MVGTNTTDQEDVTGATLVATDAAATDPRPDAVLARGSSIGRYVVIDRLGAGGMGVVYAALDPELGRQIAVKLVLASTKPHATNGSFVSPGAARLLREAQAMARLHHPNVIVVHDVGTVDGRVFIAMEYLDGGTLGEWLEAAARPWREVLTRFLAAGRGLAAAHAAGIVHRDFKSDNVLLGSDDRVVVTDFGLARAEGELGSTEENRNVALQDPFDAKLTRTGALMGTPAYMSPEQHAGSTADARSDQFAFCVALYEGLYRRRPFAGDTPASLAANVLEGALRPAPDDSDVPRWLYTVLARGLAVRADARFADMDALLAALAEDPTATRRRRLRRGALAFAAVTAVGVPVVLVQQREEVCTHARAELEAVWNQDSRARAHAAFAASSRAHAAKAWHKSELDIDSYAERWIEAHTDACEATAIRGEQSEDMLDRRMLCLQRRLREVDAVVRVLGDADDAVVDQADRARDELGDLADCSDTAALLAEVPPPTVAARAEVEAIRAELDRVAVARTVGRFTEAGEILDSLTGRVDTVDYGPLRARYLMLQGASLLDRGRIEEAEAHLYDSARVAAQAHAVALEPMIWLGLVRTVGMHHDRPLELPPLIKVAEVAVARAGNRAADQGALAVVIGTQAVLRGQFTEAEAELRKAIPLVAETRGAEHPDTLEARESLALALHGQTRYDEAEEILQAVADTIVRTLGASHPRLGPVQANISRIEAARGDLVAAAASGRAALEALMLGYGLEHHLVATAHANLATTLRKLGRYDEAKANLEAALKIERKLHGPASPRIAASIFGLAQVLMAQDRASDALATYRESLEMWSQTLGAEDPRCAYALHGIGRAELALGHRAEAIEALERGLALREVSKDVSRADLAETRFLLAEALGHADPRARELAAKARVAFVEEGAQSDIAAVDRWTNR